MTIMVTGPHLTPLESDSLSDEAFETEYLNGDDEPDADEQCQQFYDSLQQIHIDLLVEKMRILEPLLAGSFLCQPLFMHYVKLAEEKRKALEQFNEEFVGFLPTKVKKSDLAKGKTNSSVKDQFFLAWQHLTPSNGYSMKRFLKSHPMILEYLQQNIDRLMPIQNDYITFCQRRSQQSTLKPLRRSFACLEVSVKKRKTTPDALRSSH
jgi:hypothetical protein